MERIISGVVLAEAHLTGSMAGHLESCSIYGWNVVGWSQLKDPEPFFSPPRIGGGAYIDPASRVAVAAARELKTTLPSVPPEQVGCFIGTRSANAWSVALVEQARREGRRPSPLLCAHAGWNVPVVLTATELGGRGPSATIFAGDSTGREVLRAACRALQHNRAKMIIAGVIASRSEQTIGTNQNAIQSSCLLCALMLKENVNRVVFENAGFMDQFPMIDCLPGDICQFATAIGEFINEK